VTSPARSEVTGLVHSFVEHLGAWSSLYADCRYDEGMDTERLVWKSLETLIRVAGVDGCSISLTDWSEELLVRRQNGSTDRVTYNRDTIIKPGCLGHESIRSGSPQFIRSVSHDPFHNYPPAVRENHFNSVACFPLGARGRSLGALSFYFEESRNLSPMERDLGVALAQSTALALDNALLLEESSRNTLSTVQALVRFLEVRDSETSHHSLRVMQYATVLGEQLGIAAREMRAVQHGALLHDIGKIGIINEILNKKAKLTPEEYAVMRDHPQIGARIIETIDFLRDAVPGIRHHHETFDGSGYPDGLSGKDIPLIARIITVPDFYDALTSERPYREAVNPRVVLDKIRKGRGTSFDPDITDIFLTIHEGGDIPVSREVDR